MATPASAARTARWVPTPCVALLLALADIEVNGVNFRWSLKGQRAGTRSLRAVLAHEIGHVLGLSHSCSSSAAPQGDAGGAGCSRDDRLSIMYPDPTERGRDMALTPSADAIAALCARLPIDP